MKSTDTYLKMKLRKKYNIEASTQQIQFLMPSSFECKIIINEYPNTFQIKGRVIDYDTATLKGSISRKRKIPKREYYLKNV